MELVPGGDFKRLTRSQKQPLTMNTGGEPNSEGFMWSDAEQLAEAIVRILHSSESDLHAELDERRKVRAEIPMRFYYPFTEFPLCCQACKDVWDLESRIREAFNRGTPVILIVRDYVDDLSHRSEVIRSLVS